jgi:hypothetical protein
MVIKALSFQCITNVVIFLAAVVDKDICCHKFSMGGPNIMKSLFKGEATNTLSHRREEERTPGEQ